MRNAAEQAFRTLDEEEDKDDPLAMSLTTQVGSRDGPAAFEPLFSIHPRSVVMCLSYVTARVFVADFFVSGVSGYCVVLALFCCCLCCCFFLFCTLLLLLPLLACGCSHCFFFSFFHVAAAVAAASVGVICLVACVVAFSFLASCCCRSFIA